MSHLLDSLLTEDQRQQAKAADAAARVAHYQRLAAEAAIYVTSLAHAWLSYQQRETARPRPVCTIRMQPGECQVQYAEIDIDSDGRPVYSAMAIQLAGGVWLDTDVLSQAAMVALDAALVAELRRLAEEERNHA